MPGWKPQSDTTPFIAEVDKGGSKCAIKLRGLPFSATENDIYHFFRGCGYIADSAKIGRYPEGKPTGEGCILFESQELAYNAQASLNKHYIGNRYVDLFVVYPDFHKSFGEHHTEKSSFPTRGGFAGKHGGYARVGGS